MSSCNMSKPGGKVLLTEKMESYLTFQSEDLGRLGLTSSSTGVSLHSPPCGSACICTSSVPQKSEDNQSVGPPLHLAYDKVSLTIHFCIRQAR